MKSQLSQCLCPPLLRIIEKYNKDENGELMRDAAAKDHMLNTLSPSYAYVVSNDALDNALDNTHVGSIQAKVQINEEDSSQKRVLDKFSTDSSKINNKAPWSTVLRKGNNSQIIQSNSMNCESWKEDLNLLHGTASNDAQSTALSSDVNLVACNVAKHVTSVMLCTFLAERGLNVCDCKLLTRFDGARTLTYKITICPSDYEKAKDPSIWPYRVGLRLFKHFNNNMSAKRSIQSTKKTVSGNSRVV